MENLVKYIGISIRDLRKQKKLTLDQLAERSGLQTSFLAGVERGDRNITLQTLEKITIGLQVSPSTLFNFKNFVMDEEYFNKSDVINLTTDLLENISENEVKMIYKITKEILNTYH